MKIQLNKVFKRKKLIIIAVIAILLITGIVFMNQSGPLPLAALDPEDYNDNPELKELVKDFKLKTSFTPLDLSDLLRLNDEILNDSRTIDLCLTVLRERITFGNFYNIFIAACKETLKSRNKTFIDYWRFLFKKEETKLREKKKS